MNTYKISQGNPEMILAWIIGLAFIVAIISEEKNKYKDIIIGFLIITVACGTCVFLSKFEGFKHFSKLLIIIFSIWILTGDILNFHTYKINSKIKNKSIKLSSRSFISDITIILCIFISVCNQAHYRFENSVLLGTMLINLPIDYLVKYHLNVYEEGVLLDSHPFLKKLVHKKEIIPYEIIESITFSEYERGKFNLKIDVKENNKKHSYNYEIKKKDKESMISFISSFIDKEKIRVLREYDLNNTLVK